MAKEKKEKKQKVKGENDGGKSVLMIGVVLIVCSIILSGISVYMLTSGMSKMNGSNAEEVKDPDTIPLSQLESIETENIILILPSSSDPDKRMNFTFYVVFALDKKSKALEDTKTLLDTNKGIIKSKITELFSSKYVEDMLRPDSQQIMADEILVMMQELLDTDALVDVYIRDYLYR